MSQFVLKNQYLIKKKTRKNRRKFNLIKNFNKIMMTAESMTMFPPIIIHLIISKIRMPKRKEVVIDPKTIVQIQK